MPITPDLFPDFLLLNWLPDETLFSLVSRQHLLSGEVVASRTSERFFGGSRAGAQHDVPSRLATFVERTGGRLGGLQEVGLHRTLLNFYRAFITSQECTHALECMAGDSVAHLKLRLGILTSRFRAHHPLKACPVCMEEDASSTGWAYWHLQHQYPGVWVCTKHAQPLLSSTLKATGVQRFQWILPRRHELCDERAASQGDDLSGRLFRLASLIEKLVQRGAREPLPIPQLHRTYRNAMLQRGWLTAAGSLRMNVIAKEFLEHIRPLREVAEFAGLPQSMDEATIMLGRLLRPPRSGTHPLRHIVMIDWLFSDVFDFEQAVREGGLGWEEAGSISTRPAERSVDPRKKELQGLLVDEKRSARAAAKALGIDTQTAVLWAAQLGIPVTRRPKKLSDDVRATAVLALHRGADKREVAQQTGLAVGSITRLLLAEPALHDAWLQVRSEQARQRARAAWSAVLTAAAGQGVKWLRALEPGAYAWLYRHDRVWLDAHKPEATVQLVRASSVDWDARDAVLSAAVRETALRLMGEGGIRRLYFWQLYQQIPELKAKRSALHQLPLTRDAIQAVLRASPLATDSLWD